MSGRQDQDVLHTAAMGGRRWRGGAVGGALAAMALMLTLEAMDQTIVGIALPRIIGELQSADR